MTYYLPNISGLTRHASILAEELVKRNYKITVITSRSRLELVNNENINGVDVYRVGGFYLGKGFIMPLFLFRAINLVRKNEIINCHLPSVEALILAILAKLFRKKLVVTYHCYFETGLIIFDKIINLIQSQICLMADIIVVNTKDYIVGNNLLKNVRGKIFELYPPNIIETAKLNNKRKIYKVIGFLGRISKEKNIELLIEAIKELDDNIILEIAGPREVSGEEKYKHRIEKLIKSAGGKIKRLGYIDNIAKFLIQCDCLVLPSNNRLESFGLVQIEAMVNGTPCITSNLPGLRVPILTTGMGELFDPDDKNDLIKKIKLVLTKGKIYYQKRQKNIDKFSLDRAIDNYEKVLAVGKKL